MLNAQNFLLIKFVNDDDYLKKNQNQQKFYFIKRFRIYHQVNLNKILIEMNVLAEFYQIN